MITSIRSLKVFLLFALPKKAVAQGLYCLFDTLHQYHGETPNAELQENKIMPRTDIKLAQEIKRWKNYLSSVEQIPLNKGHECP